MIVTVSLCFSSCKPKLFAKFHVVSGCNACRISREVRQELKVIQLFVRRKCSMCEIIVTKLRMPRTNFDRRKVFARKILPSPQGHLRVTRAEGQCFFYMLLHRDGFLIFKVFLKEKCLIYWSHSSRMVI